MGFLGWAVRVLRDDGVYTGICIGILNCTDSESPRGHSVRQNNRFGLMVIGEEGEHVLQEEVCTTNHTCLNIG